jgi:hypothetical protein
LKLRRLAGHLHLSYCWGKGLISVKVSQVWKEGNARKWILLGLVAFLAVQIYFVQEMLALLMLFTGLFVVLAFGALILYLVDRLGQLGLGWAGKYARPVGQLARRSWVAAEELRKKPFHRPRSETVR